MELGRILRKNSTRGNKNGAMLLLVVLSPIAILTLVVIMYQINMNHIFKK